MNNSKMKTIIVAIAMVAIVSCTFLVENDSSAEEPVYFEDKGFRFIVTDDIALTASVAPLASGKYATATVLEIPKTATDGSKTYEITGIADKAFASTPGLYGIDIPEGIVTIGDDAFSSSAIYQDLVLPSTVTEIGKNSFYKATITGLDLTNTSLTAIPEGAFNSCTFMKWVKLNDGITSIGARAFAGSTAVTSIDFGTSPTLESIDDRAFQNFGMDISMALPSTILTIHEEAFASTKATEYIINGTGGNFKTVDGALFDKDVTTLLFYPINNKATSFEVPSTVTLLGENAFYGAKNLTAITIDNSVKMSGYSLTNNGIKTLIITQAAALPEGNKGIIGTYMTAANGYWSITNSTINMVVIDSTFAIDLTGITGRGNSIDFTARSVNTVGGDFKDGENDVGSADRAGKRFSTPSSSASTTFQLDNTRKITVAANPSAGGTVTGAGSIVIGETATLVATPRSGFVFSHWNDDTSLTSPEYEITVSGDASFTANFVMVENTFFTVPSNVNLEMTVNLGKAPEIGRPSSYYYYNFDHVDCTAVNDNGDGTKTYSFILENGTYGAILTGNGLVTYKDLFTKKSNTEYSKTVTLEQMKPEGKDVNYIDRSVNRSLGDDIGGILVSLTKENYIDMGVGQERSLMVYRQWQAVGNTMSNPFLEPPIKFKITDLEGKPISDIIEIVDGGPADTTFKIKALKDGTAVVTIYMEAFTLNNLTGTDAFYGATWPELTSAFVITVGGNGTFDTGMTIYDPDIKPAGDRAIDSEVDVFYYDHNSEGYYFTFTPESGTNVEVYNPVLGKVGIDRFKAGSAVKDGDSWTLLLKEGRNIVKMTNGDKTVYQVLTALPTIIEVNGKDISEMDFLEKGDAVTIIFKSPYGDYGGILNTKGKLAGIYNSSATLYYEDANGNRVATVKQPAFGHYFFVTNEPFQTLTLTIPDDYDYPIYTIYSKGVKLAGFDGSGDHRTWFRQDYTSLGALRISALPDIDLKVNAPVSVTIGAGDYCAGINGSSTLTVDAMSVDTFSVSGNVLTINGVDYVATPMDVPDMKVVFNGWVGLPEGENLGGDLNITAVFTIGPAFYTATIVAGDNCAGINGSKTLVVRADPGSPVSASGNVLIIGGVKYVASPAPSGTQSRDFRGWTGMPDSGTLDADARITAYYSETKDYYTVTVVAGNHGTVSGGSANVGAGAAIIVSGNTLTVGGTQFVATPEPTSGATVASFHRWDVPGNAKSVNGNMTITAVFTLQYAPAPVGGIVDLDLSSAGNADAAVKIPAGTKEVRLKYGNGISVDINDASLAGKTITTSITNVTNNSSVSGKAYEFVLVADGIEYKGEMEVTLPAQDIDGKEPVVYYVNGNEKVRMSTVSVSDGSITFRTDHNSLYVVSHEDVQKNSSIILIVAVVLVVVVAFLVIAVVMRRTDKS